MYWSTWFPELDHAILLASFSVMASVHTFITLTINGYRVGFMAKSITPNVHLMLCIYDVAFIIHFATGIDNYSFISDPIILLTQSTVNHFSLYLFTFKTSIYFIRGLEATYFLQQEYNALASCSDKVYTLCSFIWVRV